MKKINLISAAVSAVFALSAPGMAFASEKSFNLGAKAPGEAVSNIKTGVNMPYVGSVFESTPFYLNNNILDPVFRLRLDEGSGNVITESISGRRAEIIGEDYEWIKDAGIRFGSSVPVRLRSNTALRLNSSYVNLGKFEDLNLDKEATIVFWTNYELQGRNGDYTEPVWQTGITNATYSSAYKYDKDAHNVILKFGNTKFSIYQRNVTFDGLTGATYYLPAAIAHNNYYNMYFITIKTADDGNAYVSVYGNDINNSAYEKLLSGWSANNFGKEDVYLGMPEPEGNLRSSQLGIADLMIFDRALSYPERLMLYNGFNQTGYYSNRIPE